MRAGFVLHHSCSMRNLRTAVLATCSHTPESWYVWCLTLVSVRRPWESYRAADFGANLPEEEDDISFDEPSPTGKSGALATGNSG